MIAVSLVAVLLMVMFPWLKVKGRLTRGQSQERGRRAGLLWRLARLETQGVQTTPLSLQTTVRTNLLSSLERFKDTTVFEDFRSFLKDDIISLKCSNSTSGILCLVLVMTFYELLILINMSSSQSPAQ